MRRLKLNHDKIEQLWHYGLSTSAIAERMGCGRSTISAILTGRGIKLMAHGIRQRYDMGAGILRGSRRAARGIGTM